MGKILLVVSLALSLGACFSMPPRADEWTFWKKRGWTDPEDAKRVMLECGSRMYADYSSEHAEYEKAKQNPDTYMAYLGKYVLFERCMEKEGFRYTSEFGTTCKGGRYSRAYPELPECQLPIEQIPGRDVNKRLNSPYCSYPREGNICKP